MMTQSQSVTWASSLSKDKPSQPPRPKQELNVQSRVSTEQSHEKNAEGDGVREWGGRERGSHGKQQTDTDRPVMRPPQLSGQGLLNAKPGSNFRDFFLKQVWG
jgi:hypothetical protein